MFTFLEIPEEIPAYMSGHTYEIHQDKVGDAIHNVMWRTIVDAGKEEAELART